MPSLVIDTAATAAQEEIDAAISNMCPSKLAPSSSRHHQDFSSPLFRDEVVQQELRYFNRVLRADNGVGGCGYNLPAYKPSFGGERVVERSNNNDMNQKSKYCGPNSRSDIAFLPTSNQHCRSAKQPKHHVVRSRNIRQQTNRKLLQKAKLSSRKVMRKLSKIGKSCSKKWDLVANKIHHKILEAVASMNSLLENNGVVDTSQQSSRRSFGQVVSQHQRGCAACDVQTDGNNSRRGAQPRAPPQICFTGASLWFKNRTQSISSKAIAKAKDSIRKRNVSVTL